MNHHERELREALSSPIAAGIIEVRRSVGALVEGMELAFPFVGSKIHWNSVQGHLATTASDGSHADFLKFFDARRSELGGDQSAFYLNDDLLDCALCASLFTFQRHLDAIISIPAHHYFFDGNFGWCIAYTMEGNIDFGWSSVKR